MSTKRYGKIVAIPLSQQQKLNLMNDDKFVDIDPEHI